MGELPYRNSLKAARLPVEIHGTRRSPGPVSLNDIHVVISPASHPSAAMPGSLGAWKIPYGAGLAGFQIL